MENNPVAKILDGTFPCAYSPSTFQGFLALSDIAYISASILVHPEQHAYARYELVGQNCTLEDAAKTASRVLGKEVKVEVIPREKAVAAFSESKGIDTFDGKDG
jgi:uncharacterized protein YbjT (DUF2867 family)